MQGGGDTLRRQWPWFCPSGGALRLDARRRGVHHSLHMKMTTFSGNLILGLIFTGMVCLQFLPLRAEEKKPAVAKSDEDKTTGEPKKDEAKKPESKPDAKEPKDEISETTNSVTINGVEIRYKAAAGTLVMKDEE